jgi:hypothetical protein
MHLLSITSNIRHCHVSALPHRVLTHSFCAGTSTNAHMNTPQSMELVCCGSLPCIFLAATGPFLVLVFILQIFESPFELFISAVTQRVMVLDIFLLQVYDGACPMCSVLIDWEDDAIHYKNALPLYLC